MTLDIYRTDNYQIWEYKYIYKRGTLTWYKQGYFINLTIIWYYKST